MKRDGDRVHDARTTPLRTSMTPLAPRAARTAATVASRLTTGCVWLKQVEEEARRATEKRPMSSLDAIDATRARTWNQVFKGRGDYEIDTSLTRCCSFGAGWD